MNSREQTVQGSEQEVAHLKSNNEQLLEQKIEQLKAQVEQLEKQLEYVKANEAWLKQQLDQKLIEHKNSEKKDFFLSCLDNYALEISYLHGIMIQILQT